MHRKFGPGERPRRRRFAAPPSDVHVSPRQDPARRDAFRGPRGGGRSVNRPLAASGPNLGAELRAATLATLVAAFEADDAARTLYPGDLDYARHFPGFLAAFGGRAFEAGVVDRDLAGLGAALWFPPGLEPDGAGIIAHLEATLQPERLAALAAGMELQGAMHPHEPHWYLPWIGVRPAAQGTGLGSKLLARGLARADADGLPSYLEATSRRNAALYARHGFEPLGMVASPGYPEIIPMWRPAHH